MPRRGPLDVLILGPVPPPLGGVSVHIRRVVPLLQEAGLEVAVLNHFSSVEFPWVAGALRRNPLRYLWSPRRYETNVLHYHHSRWSPLVAVALGKGRSSTRYILTLHADELRRELESRVPGVGALTRWALRRFDSFTAVSPQIAAFIRDYVPDRPIEVVPAFVPSSESVRAAPEIESFLAAGKTVVVAAYKVQFLPDGRELYGLDTAVAAYETVASERDELQLAIFVAEPPTGRRAIAHWSRLEKILADAHLGDRARLFVGRPLVPAFGYDVVFVRPTRVEGDALSVREALQAGVPVIASNVAVRPSGVVTFAADDATGLAEALRDSLTAAAPEERQRSSTPTTEFVETLLGIYGASA